MKEETINKKEFLEYLKGNLKKIEESILHIRFMDEKKYSEGLLRGQRLGHLHIIDYLVGLKDE